MPRQDPGNLVWADLEFTGLKPVESVIIEIATLVTDADLHVLAEGPNLVIHHGDDVLELALDEWAREHHTASGLLDRVRASRISLAEAEEATLDFVRAWVPERTAPLCGNSIWQDRRFIARYMPALDRYLLHRNVDVSSIRELVHRWYPADLHWPGREKEHLALADIRDSIDELRWYREHIFRPDRRLPFPRLD